MTNEIAVTFLPGDTITAAKLNAMQQSLAVEGDYTSYKYVWGRNYTGVATSYIYIFHVSNTGTVTFTDYGQDVLYKKTYSGAESSSAGHTNAIYTTTNAEGSCKSVLGTYYAIPHPATDNVTLKIYKDDALLQTIAITDDDVASDKIVPNFPIVFSPNGRYFALVSEVVGSSDALYLTLYEADV